MNPLVLMPSKPVTSARRQLLSFCEKALFHSNVHRLCRMLQGDGGTTILMYHSVPGPDAAQWIDPRDAVAPALFEQQMQTLVKHCHVVSLTELVEAIEIGRSLPNATVVITFDDGYLDNFEVAAPILASFDLPATFFLATGYIDRESPQWIDELYSIYRARSANVLHVGWLSTLPYDLTRQHDVDASYTAISEIMLATDIAGRKRLFDELTVQLRPTRTPPRLTMNWDEVRRLQAMHSGFEIGVHTRDHLSLPCLDTERMAVELTQCIADVRTMLGLEPRFFSYPYGRSCECARRLVANRFRAAVATDPPALVRAGADLLALPRVSPPDDPALFRLYTSGAQPDMVRRLLRGA
ncbi:MAG TPA: polysaccharide deacetylase family protein [Planctomycetota bacterium]